jgi:glycyl-tRNA synthetase beta chain
VRVDELKVKETPRGRYVFIQKKTPGRKTAEVLAEVLPGVIGRISFPKSMLWPGSEVAFARPIRWILALFGTRLVAFEKAGVKSGRFTFGHPFLSSPRRVSRGKKVNLARADWSLYLDQLKENFVIVDMAERRGLIKKKAERILSGRGLKLEEDERIGEVASLVEYPAVALGSFPEKFLSLPEPILTEAMWEYQHYLPVRDAKGRLVPGFIVVTNRTAEAAREIVKGNERVLVARLADAQYFFAEDKKRGLAQRVEDLEGVLFEERLGSYLQRTGRLEGLAQFLGKRLGLSKQRIDYARRAAHLAKADLTTQVVGEFPRLQGIMGGEYAQVSGEPEEVAAAIAEHYLPRFAGDRLPQTEVGRVVALSDKFDLTLACFAVGLRPTGSQDPYALRRAASGIIRIILDAKVEISLEAVLAAAEKLLPDGVRPGPEDLKYKTPDFFRERIYQYFLEEGYPYDIIRGVLVSGFDDILDVKKRLDALKEISASKIWPALVEVVERTCNIARSLGLPGDQPPEINPQLFTEKWEGRLYEIYQENKTRIERLVAGKKYLEASKEFEKVFARPVHEFFEEVFVMVEDERLRRNRQSLVLAINLLYSSRIADLSEIVTGIEKEPTN